MSEPSTKPSQSCGLSEDAPASKAVILEMAGAVAILRIVNPPVNALHPDVADEIL
jgi:hypothetical protein